MIITQGIHTGKSFRESQETAYEFITNSTKRFICLSAPTGIGKSICSFESMPSPFWYLCSSIHLEHQLIHDFPKASLLKGRSNYSCDMFESADLCMIAPPCDYCEYAAAKDAALMNKHSILNFHYFLYASNFAEFCTENEGMRNVIIDEADALENILTGFISFIFSLKQLQYLNIVQYPPSKKPKIESFVDWLKPLRTKIIQRMKEMTDHVMTIKHKIKQGQLINIDDMKILRKHQRLSGVAWKVNFLNGQDLFDDNWIYYNDKNKIILKPKWLTRELSDTFLFNHGKRFLFMSATLPPKPVFCGLYGFDPSEVDYLELDHPFKIENRRVVYRPRFSLTKKELDKEG